MYLCMHSCEYVFEHERMHLRVCACMRVFTYECIHEFQHAGAQLDFKSLKVFGPSDFNAGFFGGMCDTHTQIN